MNAFAPLQPALPLDDFGPQRQWLASLQLGFDRGADRTRLHHLLHQGPLRVQKPFYPEADCCHVYLLHPPGGLVSGDQLEISIKASAQAHALITTPSAGKIYKGDTNGVSQCQQLSIAVAEGAVVEWLPQETILFDGALGRTQSRIDLEEDARFIGWELIGLGRPASQESFCRGHMLQQMSIYRDGKPLLLERQDLHAGSELSQQAWGIQGKTVVANAYASGFEAEPQELIDQLRELHSDESTARYAISWRRDVLVIRYLGDEMEAARHYLEACWQLIRPQLLDRPAITPRIWLT